MEDANFGACEADYLEPEDEHGRYCITCGQFFYCAETDESEECLICATGE